jgi:hypothetical protein|tara:strand:+ start:682 stop:864 length:183 start_codon:yes stop_codon:yes gene_type:complete
LIKTGSADENRHRDRKRGYEKSLWASNIGDAIALPPLPITTREQIIEVLGIIQNPIRKTN